MLDSIKAHVVRHKTVYISVGVAGITFVITRGVYSHCIRGGFAVPAQGGISVLGKNNVLNNVSYISANRQGPPSWVVRCLETGDIFTSQKSAGNEMDLPYSEISKQINGVIDHVRGFHFERICLAA